MEEAATIAEKPNASLLQGFDPEKEHTRKKGGAVFLFSSSNGYFEHFELGFCMIKD